MARPGLPALAAISASVVVERHPGNVDVADQQLDVGRPPQPADQQRDEDPDAEQERNVDRR